MTSLNIWLIVSLFLTLSTSLMMMWYVRRLLAKYLFLSQNLNDLVEMVDNYQKHLKQVYSMETYHGDETIQYLLSHTNSLLEMLDDYKDVYIIADPIEVTEENIEYAEDPPIEDQETTPTPIQVSEENVFYAGTRRGNS